MHKITDALTEGKTDNLRQVHKNQCKIDKQSEFILEQ